MVKRILVTVFLLVSLYLFGWPIDIAPVAWTPPPAPSLESGTYATNDRLRGVQRLVDGGVAGPEAIAVDASGRIYSGLADGRVIRASADGRDCVVLAKTGGRPLGLSVQADGRLIITDALKGLIEVFPDRHARVLATEADGIPILFPDDLAVDSAGRVYFSDASWRRGYGKHVDEALEHRPNGRLLRYDPVKDETYGLIVGLHFANGVALGPDESFVLVNESTEYRIKRFWLKGERAGQTEVFIDNLPGIPDNLSFNGRDRFWVALYAPRDKLLDSILPSTFWRSVVARLPEKLKEKPAHHAFILGLDVDGKVVEQYQYDDSTAYAPITHVQESNGYLYLGSLSATAIGRIALNELRRGGASAAPPPPVTGTCSEEPA